MCTWECLSPSGLLIVSKSAFFAGDNYLTSNVCPIFSVIQWPNFTTGHQSKSLKPLNAYLIVLYLNYWFRTQLWNLINIHNYQPLIFMWLCRCHLHILYLYIWFPWDKFQGRRNQYRKLPFEISLYIVFWKIIN